MESGSPTLTPELPAGHVLLGQQVEVMNKTEIKHDGMINKLFIEKTEYRDLLEEYLAEEVPGFVPPWEDGLEDVGLGKPVIISPENLDTHCFVVGASNSGKTMLLVNMLVAQAKAGCSIVMLEQKIETLLYVVTQLRAAGISPEAIKLTLPSEHRGGMSTFNPLYCAHPRHAMRAADNFCSVLDVLIGDSWSPRMKDFTTNIAVVISALDGSVADLVRFMQDPEFRKRTLNQLERRKEELYEYIESVVEYFEFEFPHMTEAYKREMSQAALNKLRTMVKDGFFKMFFAPVDSENVIRIGDLFKSECPQRIHLIHLDTSELGEQMSFLAGMMSYYTLQEALRGRYSTRKVVLCIDEIGVTEHYLGKELSKTVVFAREKQLRLFFACQNFAQLSSGLKAALQGSAGVKIYFRLGSLDAPVAAKEISIRSEKDNRKLLVRLRKPRDFERDNPSYSKFLGKNKSIEYKIFPEKTEVNNFYQAYSYSTEIKYPVAELDSFKCRNNHNYYEEIIIDYTPCFIFNRIYSSEGVGKFAFYMQMTEEIGKAKFYDGKEFKDFNDLMKFFDEKGFEKFSIEEADSDMIFYQGEKIKLYKYSPVYQIKKSIIDFYLKRNKFVNIISEEEKILRIEKRIIRGLDLFAGYIIEDLTNKDTRKLFEENIKNSKIPYYQKYTVLENDSRLFEKENVFQSNLFCGGLKLKFELELPFISEVTELECKKVSEDYQKVLQHFKNRNAVAFIDGMPPVFFKAKKMPDKSLSEKNIEELLAWVKPHNDDVELIKSEIDIQRKKRNNSTENATIVQVNFENSNDGSL